MALTCQKCRQAVPHESDSWCLACSAVEALVAELRNSWGSQGSRALAADLVVSGLRQVRALRRLGLAAGGGRAVVRASTAEGRETPRGKLPPPEPAVPPRSSGRGEASEVPPAPAEVKAEVEEDEEESESEATEEESPCAGASPKCKAEPLPRRRSTGGERTEPREGEAVPRVGKEEAAGDRGRSSLAEGSDRRGDRQRGVSVGRLRTREERSHKERRDRSRSRKKKSSRTGPHCHQGEGAPRKKRRHRAGSKHQRLYRASENPYKRFHHRRPDGYWDQDVTEFR